MKIHEIAKELNIPSKDVVEKAQSMGYEVKSHMSNLDDKDAAAVKNSIIHTMKAAETKIVKVKPKKKGETEDKNVQERVVVKAAPKPPVKPAKPKATIQSTREDKADAVKAPSRKVDPASTKPGEKSDKPIPKRIPADKAVPKRIPKEKVSEIKPEEEKEVVKSEPVSEVSDKEAAKSQEKKVESPKKVDEKETKEIKTFTPKATEKAEKKPTETKPVKETKQPAKPSPKTPDKGKAKTSEIKTDKSSQNKATKPKKDKRDKGPGKRNESPGEKARKRNLKKEKQKGMQDDFKGSKKRPILGDFSLEKKPVKSKNRPKNKPAPEPEEVIKLEELAPGTVVINVPITVAGFAEQINKSTSEVIMQLMKLGIMANINQNLDEDTVLLLADDLNVPIVIGKDIGDVIEEGFETFEDKEEDLVPRPPIITVMGHVDHGKTSLLDAIRKTNVTDAESGGITQHIGAYEVKVDVEGEEKKIVFLDTPGHEAFTAMRARGAHITDIAVLVVAADDSVKPQTIESISHAKAAGVPIIVAINKMDKPGANPDKVKQDLADNGILVEDWGGDTISVPVSAKSGDGIVSLLEYISLQADLLELKANPNRLALGTVIEARLDKAKGTVASILVLNGTLDAGVSIVAGTTSGRIRAMADYKGKKIKKAGPSTPVEVLGLTEVPQAGDEFRAVKEDKVAREIAENRRVRLRDELMTQNKSTSLEQIFSQIKDGEFKELNLIIKGDVQGSVGALTAALEKLDNKDVKIKIIHTGVGAINESDVMLAETSGAIIIGFHVRPSTAVSNVAERSGVEIRTYRIIYDVINDIEAAMIGMLDPEYKEVIMGKVEIRETFKVPGIGVIGGAYVLEGIVKRNADVRLVRDGIVIHEGKISSLKRFKDDAKEVAAGYECGIGIENYNDIKVGDIIEAFTMEEIER